MRCLSDEAISAVLDREASPEECSHVASCKGCARKLEDMRSLDEALRSLPLANESAPSTLAATLRGIRAKGSRSVGRLSRVAAGGAAMALAVATLLFFSGEGAVVQQALADQAISSHLQAFSRGDGSGCHMESQDPQELASWFTANLGGLFDVPPPLRDARLVGGRECQLFGESTAAVVYRTEEAPVTVFLPRPGSTAFSACEESMGTCTEGRDGQTVCVLPGGDGSPMVVVGALSPSRLCEVVGS